MASTARSPRSTGLLPPPAKSVVGPSNPAGYLISHRINNSFVLINRLLKAHADVYWLKSAGATDGEDLGTGTIWVPASAAARPVLEKSAKDLGVTVHAVAKAPTGDAMKLKPIRIGLYDQYGGSMPSGWTRWLFEQYEFPFEVVYPATLDAGDLKSKFDVIVFTDGAIRRGGRGWARRRWRRRRRRARSGHHPGRVPGHAGPHHRRQDHARSSRSSWRPAAAS